MVKAEIQNKHKRLKLSYFENFLDDTNFKCVFCIKKD